MVWCGAAKLETNFGSAVDTIIKQEPQSEGQKMRKSRQYTSRVHVEDICQALKASIYTPSSRWAFIKIILLSSFLHIIH
jgi:hypothetical protein